MDQSTLDEMEKLRNAIDDNRKLWHKQGNEIAGHPRPTVYTEEIKIKLRELHAAYKARDEELGARHSEIVNKCDHRYPDGGSAVRVWHCGGDSCCFCGKDWDEIGDPTLEIIFP